MSRKVYKTEEGKQASISLYEEQLRLLDTPYSDIYIDIDFGNTHLIETGKTTGKPLLVSHGGNTTTAYNLYLFRFLLEEFHIYAVDTIGHPGKSAEKNIVCEQLELWAVGEPSRKPTRFYGDVRTGLFIRRRHCRQVDRGIARED